MTPKIPVNQQINKLGKYLKKHIDGAYSMKISANMCDVYVSLYYQYSILPDRPGDEMRMSDLFEMKFNINITTYANKLRINLIEVHPDEQTIGHFVIDENTSQDIVATYGLTIKKIRNLLSKHFDGYEFIF